MHALKGLLTAACALAILASGAPPAPAAIDRISTDDDGLLTRTYGGGTTDLPVRPTLLWREAVAWARTMPAVQSAMQTFAERGYVAVPERDSAANSIDPPATFVALSYEKPNLDLTGCTGRPLIVVFTRLDGEGVPATVVTAGLLIADEVHQSVFPADSLPALAVTDPSFDVGASGGGGAGSDPGDRRLFPGPNWRMSSKFGKFLACFSMMSGPCVFNLWQDLSRPADPVSRKAEASAAIIRFLVCEIGAGITCVTTAAGGVE